MDIINNIIRETNDPYDLEELYLAEYNNRNFEEAALYYLAAVLCNHYDISNDYFDNFGDEPITEKIIPKIVKMMKAEMDKLVTYFNKPIALYWEK